MSLRRYDYIRYIKEMKTRTEDRYALFDRNVGVTAKLAVVYDPADAELICAALNAYVKEPA